MKPKTKTILLIIMLIIITITPTILVYSYQSIKHNSWDCREWPFMSTENQKQAEAK